MCVWSQPLLYSLSSTFYRKGKRKILSLVFISFLGNFEVEYQLISFYFSGNKGETFCPRNISFLAIDSRNLWTVKNQPLAERERDNQDVKEKVLL